MYVRVLHACHTKEGQKRASAILELELKPTKFQYDYQQLSLGLLQLLFTAEPSL